MLVLFLCSVAVNVLVWFLFCCHCVRCCFYLDINLFVFQLKSNSMVNVSVSKFGVRLVAGRLLFILSLSSSFLSAYGCLPVVVCQLFSVSVSCSVCL